MSSYATTKQIDFISKLVTERKDSSGVTDVDAFVRVLVEQRVTRDGASKLIDRLLSTKPDAKPVVAQAAAAAPAAPAIRTNRYAGACEKCGKRVQANAGSLDKINGRWVTAHLDGECPVDLDTKLTELIGDLPDGFYAVTYIGLDADRTDLTFLGVRTRTDGRRHLVHVVGGHGETDGMSFEWCERAVAALRACELEQAAQVYGQELGHCGRCGRTLTNEASRHLGIGPECATKGW